MGVVTNVIITMPIDEPGIHRLNELLEARKTGDRFNQVDDYCGGTKAFEADVWLAAFNWMNLDEFVAMVRTAEWYEPENLRIFVQQQEEDSFSNLVIFS